MDEETQTIDLEPLQDIKKLLVANLELVQAVLKGAACPDSSGVTETMLAQLRKDNESLRSTLEEINTKEWSRMRQFNSLTKRLRFYFDKAHEMRELVINNKSALVSIDECICKLGISKRKTTLETVKFLAEYYKENSPPEAAAASQDAGKRRKVEI